MTNILKISIIRTVHFKCLFVCVFAPLTVNSEVIAFRLVSITFVQLTVQNTFICEIICRKTFFQN
jgi:hypothetical protein